ncbi:MAG: family 43 glycosylhydrolase [Acholeplasmatales bacterium]|jgi:hypothetical protein|nr:family 43 glycosylhydrolase [Acholeplasmatales bacterium]
MRKLLIAIIASLFVLSVTSCATTYVPEVESWYKTTVLSKDSKYNSNLFYLNTLEFQIADPSVIYINEGPEKGYFYAYGTSDDINCQGFQSWRSKDMTRWESMGIAYTPSYATTWSIVNYWAPEVIYDSEEELYYMFFSAQRNMTNDSRYKNLMMLSVAYSASPAGPFVHPNNNQNLDGKLLKESEPVFDFSVSNEDVVSTGLARKNTIDVSPFIDPVTKEKYMYFSYYDSFTKSEIFGVKMKDWFTPDYSSLVQLTSVGFLTVEAGLNHTVSKSTPEGSINEGPFMYYRDGKYYLTLSVFGYSDERYQVRQAVSTSPLGNFTKYHPDNGGVVVATDPTWDHITSAGHHSFVVCGEDLFIAYHTFKNRTDITGGRALAIDKIEFIKNNDGISLMHTNGPTYSLQPLPSSVSGYENIASKASVSASNTAKGSSVSLLTDGLLPYLMSDNNIEEYTANSGKSKITFDFSSPVTLRAFMVYNSMEYDNTFINISSVKIKYYDTITTTKELEIGKTEFDFDWNLNEVDGSIMRPGGSVVSEFDELRVSKIEFNISSVGSDVLSIPEIVLLGKTTPCAPKSDFKEYEYNISPVGSSQIVKDSVNFGTNNTLKTGFGWDLSNDSNSLNAFVNQSYCSDQYLYFKKVFSTDFYVEAKITSTNLVSFNNDKYPKYGLVVSCPENTIFFYIDGIGSQRVGVAQRTLDNKDWNWNATEQLVTMPGTLSTNGEYAKLSIIRQGKNFIFLVNDKVAIIYNSFNVFNDYQDATAGLLTFNMAISAKEYSITSDKTVIDQKISEYASTTSGNVFGLAGGLMSSPGWDLSTDTNSANAYVSNTQAGDQYLYFKDINSSYFYAETLITVDGSLQDPYPKIGISIKNGNKEIFFYIDCTEGYNNKAVGYVERVDGNWDWAGSVTKEIPSLGSYKNPNFVKMAVLRDNGNIYFLIEGEIAFTINNAEKFSVGDACVVAILSFTTKVTVKEYYITINSAEVAQKIQSIVG